MPFREQGFLCHRRLSAGSQDARHAADGRKSSQGAGDDSEGQAAEDRSGAGRERTAGEIVEVVEVVGWAKALFAPCPPFDGGSKAKGGGLASLSPPYEAAATLRYCLPDGWLRTGTRCGARFHR